jgi:hypothetical protein
MGLKGSSVAAQTACLTMRTGFPSKYSTTQRPKGGTKPDRTVRAEATAVRGQGHWELCFQHPNGNRKQMQDLNKVGGAI